MGRNIARRSIGTGDLQVLGLSSDNMASGAIMKTHLLDAQIDSSYFKVETLLGRNFATGAVSEMKIADATITSANLIDSAIKKIHLQDNVVYHSKITNNQISSGKIAKAAISSAKLIDSLVIYDNVGGASTPDEHIVFELRSTTKGFLPPRMDTSALSVAEGDKGAMIYDSVNHAVRTWKGDRWLHQKKNNTEVIHSRTVSMADTVLGASIQDSILHEGLYYGLIEVKGRVWLDRNLGATRRAKDVTDRSSATTGYFFSWGRAMDGHQLPIPTAPLWSPSKLLSPYSYRTDQIITSNPWFDTDSAAYNEIWSVSSPNNPCPVGFRPPTASECEIVCPEGDPSATILSSCIEALHLVWTTHLKRDNNNGVLKDYSGTDRIPMYTKSTNRGKGKAWVTYRKGGVYGTIEIDYHPADSLPVRCIRDD